VKDHGSSQQLYLLLRLQTLANRIHDETWAEFSTIGVAEFMQQAWRAVLQYDLT
jgi:hypothetical protein